MTGRLHFVDVETLAERLEQRPDSVVAVDCRFNLLEPDAGFRRYLEGHIPGARYAHLDRDLARLPGAADGRHPLPSRDAFCRFLGAIGVAAGTLVVAYDDCGGALAARLWWLLGEVGHSERALLDGGIVAWRNAGNALETDLPTISPTQFTPAASINAPTLSVDDVRDFISSGGVLLDARSGERFEGRQEPIDPVAGHIPGARNLPVGELFDASGLLRPEAEWRQSLEALVEGRESDQVGVMCGSGVTACMLAAAMESAGLGSPRVYPGSWSEWIRDPARPVAAGAAMPPGG